MPLSTTIASLALALAVILVMGHAQGETITPKETAQKKVEAREAQRRAAAAEQERRKQDFAKHCNKPVKTDSEFEACRAAYRKL
jgi:hypothetical protein